MLAIFKPRQPFRYGGILLLLIILSACSRNGDIPRPTRITQIQFKENLLTVAAGSSAELKVLHSPSELNPPGYDWSVSDASVANVENGKVYGLKVGETEVSVLARGLGLTARIKIRVVPVLPKVLRLQAEKTSLSLGEETLITYSIDPPEVTDPDKLEIEWSSSDETVCKVSGGKVLTVGAGTADVVAQIKGTAITGTLRIQVALVPVESVSLNLQQVYVTVGAGTRLVSRILPANATDQRLTWSSDDPQVATVIQGTVLGVKEGTTTIRVSTVDGGKTASCQVTVTPVQVERIILSSPTLSLAVAQEHTLTATVLPEQAKDKSLKWNSSNLSVATVDQQGKIMTKGKGTAIIWAISVPHPRVQSACQVVVVNPEDMIFTQVNTTSKVSINGYVSANLSALIENGYSVPIKLISFEVLSHTGEVIMGNYQTSIISPSIQQRHTGVIQNVFRPFIRYVFELNGSRFERRLEIE
ncbi:MAG: Ig-like domain-containing protein [Pedobacter sp.]|uniref:Ig-like domain-containing protein n=1 Tax=Pedobacter sp. TaxID=1411316 RepID=UPI003563F3F8